MKTKSKIKTKTKTETQTKAKSFSVFALRASSERSEKEKLSTKEKKFGQVLSEGHRHVYTSIYIWSKPNLHLIQI